MGVHNSDYDWFIKIITYGVTILVSGHTMLCSFSTLLYAIISVYSKDFHFSLYFRHSKLYWSDRWPIETYDPKSKLVLILENQVVDYVLKSTLADM